MEFEELKGKIEAAIDMLPAQCKQVFNLSRFEEMKNKEVAEKLGISVKAVEAHITKALKKLRLELKDHLPIIALITNLFL